jgi:hypothetical protein
MRPARPARIVALAVILLPALQMVSAAPARAAMPATVRGQAALWPANPDWQRYVEAPASSDLYPVRVVSVSGDVVNAAGLVNRSGGTTLTYSAGGTAPILVLDYGQEVGGLPQFSVASVGRPSVLQSAYSEQLANLSTTGDIAGGFPLAGAGSPRRYDQQAVANAGTFTDILVQGGERYQLLTLAVPGSLTLQSVGVHYLPLRGTADTFQGHFVSSSDLLNRIWYAGVYTLNLDQVPSGSLSPPQILPVVYDGAKHDRLVWAGDIGQEGPTLYYAQGSAGAAYVKGSLTAIGDHPCAQTGIFSPCTATASVPGPLPGACWARVPDTCFFYSATYSMAFVIGLRQYYMYTGDASFVSQRWPLVQREIAWETAQVDGSGLFAANALDGFDWNVSVHSGNLAYDNILYYEALNAGAQLADAVGQPAIGSDYRALAATLKSAINAGLWDPQLGAYDASTTERGFYVEDANVAAILSGVAAPERAKAIESRLAAALSAKFGMLSVGAGATSNYSPPLDKAVISPYMGGFALQADFASRNDDLAYALMRTEWGYMLNGDPGGTAWERMNPDGTLAPADSTAHGWGSGATSALSQYVLGVAPTAPGYRTYLVEPHPGDLSWVEGEVPTAHGPITVRWGHDARAGGFTMETIAPSGVEGVVAVPLLGGPRVITEDGAVVWDGAAPAGSSRAQSDGVYVRFAGVAGKHMWASWTSAAPAATTSPSGVAGLANTAATASAWPATVLAALALLGVGRMRRRRR